ncbi:MAG: alanine--tRNA ligase-related protein [Lawsonibacter sp.]|nr:alanine--tRNA ligase-related protein [Lawsonibacter sp.]
MEKLYEEQPYLTEFSASVVSCTPGKKGFELLLDQTAFYPEGGGQPWDTGTLGSVRVLEVHARDGQIIHLCDGPLDPGTQVTGAIDWDRRFDLMQQHSGEHIVSGIAHAKWGCDNVGFHMGSDIITIDLNVVLDDEQLRELETEANRYLWEDHSISITFPSPAELETLEYRSKKALTGQVRIVSFPGADTCACCGTHVATSGQVGLIKLLSVQKFRDGVRIELVCGGRALRYLNQVMEQNRQVSNLLSAKLFETGAAVRRLLEENAALKSHILTMENHRFSALAQQAAGAKDVLLVEEGLSPDGLRRLCDTLLRVCGGRCACFSGDDVHGYPYAIGLQGGDLRAFTKQMNQALGGRGGGKPEFVQGFVQATRDEIESFFQLYS